MTEPRQPDVRRRTGLSEADARRLLAAAGERSPAPAGRSYRNIVLANTLTLFNLILLVFFVVMVVAGRPADGLFAFIVVGKLRTRNHPGDPRQARPRNGRAAGRSARACGP